MNFRDWVRNSGKLRELTLRLLSSERVHMNPVYRSIYRRQIERRMRAGLERPDSIDIESSSLCNAKCVMCAHSRMTREQGNMPWEIFEKIAREAVEWDIPRMYLSGFGEALIDKTLPDKVAFAKQLGAPWVGVLTNGSLLTESTVERLLESGLDQLAVSMDGFSPETFNTIRVGLDFNQVVGNINRLLNQRKGSLPRIQIQVVLLPQNRNQKRQARRMWSGKVDSLVFRQAQNWCGAVEVSSGQFTPHTVGKNKLVPCRYLWTQLNVHHNGDVVLCCADWDNRKVIGNVKDQSLRGIWRASSIEAVRELHRQGRHADEPLCRNCSYFSVWW